MGYLVRPECPKCGDNADVDEIVIGSAKKTIGGAATGAAIGSVVPGLGTLIGGAIGGAVGLIAGTASGLKHVDIDDISYAQAKKWSDGLEQLQFHCTHCKHSFFRYAQLKE